MLLRIRAFIGIEKGIKLTYPALQVIAALDRVELRASQIVKPN